MFFKEICEQLKADKHTGQKGTNKKRVWSLNAQSNEKHMGRDFGSCC